MVPFPPLDSPKPSFEPRRPSARAPKRGLRGLGSGRRADFGTLLCPEVSLRDLPRMTVRGQTVQGAGLALRKAPLRSRAYPWSTKRPCGPLAFRRATVGSRVQRRVWGVKRGKGTIGALSPLVSAARRRHSHALRGRKVAYSGAPLYRRKVERLLTVKKGSYCLRQQLSLRIKQKHRLKVDAFTSGAADEARTRYLHLGKVALYQMSYSRILWCLRAESLSLRRKPRRLKQFTELFLRAAFRFRKRKRKIGASGRNRTTDTGIFSPLLYRLSYRGIF